MAISSDEREHDVEVGVKAPINYQIVEVYFCVRNYRIYN